MVNMTKKRRLWNQPGFRLFLLTIPLLLLVCAFSYLPLTGWAYAFFDYRAGMKLRNCDFVGLKHFLAIFDNPLKQQAIVRVMKNTLGMSFLGILTSPLPMVFALLLNQIRSRRYRKAVQILTTLPNFISWVLVYAVVFALLSTDGFVNQMLLQLGLIDKGVNFLADPSHTWLKMWAYGTWKTLGWSAVMYLAALGSVDYEQVEAARIDGAGRWQVVRHIEFPALLPTFFVLLLLSIGNIINSGMEQYFVFENAMNKSTIEVLDLYVYHQGMSNNQIPYATAVSIWAFSNCNDAELFLNGRSVGRKQKERLDKFTWQVPYEKGVLRVAAYEAGQAVCEDCVVTAGPPVRLLLCADKEKLRADGADISVVSVTAVDRDGNEVTDAELTVHFSVTSAGTIKGVGNGRPDSLEHDKHPVRKLYAGKAVVLVESGFEAGEVVLAASADGLEPALVHLACEKGADEPCILGCW